MDLTGFETKKKTLGHLTESYTVLPSLQSGSIFFPEFQNVVAICLTS